MECASPALERRTAARRPGERALSLNGWRRALATTFRTWTARRSVGAHRCCRRRGRPPRLRDHRYPWPFRTLSLRRWGRYLELVNSDARLTSRGWYFNSLAIDPTNPDVLYIPNVALYRTEDGGKTIQIVRGAPGGDDYHQVWIDPQNDAHLCWDGSGDDREPGRGKTWTTWYNQPTAQLYHVTTDHKFPYSIYGAQQDSGSIAIHSRSDHEHIDTRDWFLPEAARAAISRLIRKTKTLFTSPTPMAR